MYDRRVEEWYGSPIHKSEPLDSREPKSGLGLWRYVIAIAVVATVVGVVFMWLKSCE